MPIHEFRCRQCDHRFSEFFRRMLGSDEAGAVACPQCCSADTVRVVARFAVHGPSGADPQEQVAEWSHQQRMASITPKEQIDKWNKGGN